MSKFYLVVALGVTLYLLWHSRWARSVREFFRNQRSSSRRSLTMFDVRECIIEGEEDLAVQIYRDLFHVSEEEARQAVDQLARSIREKNGS